MYILGNVATIPQKWLQNMNEVCDYDFAVDEDGNLIPDMEFFFYKRIMYYTFYFAMLGFYLGQLCLSYKNHDIPEINTFTSCSAFLTRVWISILGLVLCGLHLIVDSFLKSLSLWI